LNCANIFNKLNLKLNAEETLISSSDRLSRRTQTAASDHAGPEASEARRSRPAAEEATAAGGSGGTTTQEQQEENSLGL
jgi:hypothetical protein